MIFLNDADISARLRDELRPLLAGADESVLHTIEAEAVSEAQTYLRTRFDVALAFLPRPTTPEGEPAPDTRHHALVMYVTDMMVYHLYARLDPRQLPQLRQDRYDQALRWLEWCSAGKLTPDLPALGGGDTPLSQRRYGSQPRGSHYA